MEYNINLQKYIYIYIIPELAKEASKLASRSLRFLAIKL